MRIVGALINPVGPAPEAETVTLLNATPHDVDLTGWAILDRLKQRMTLTGPVLGPATPPGSTSKRQSNWAIKAA